MAASAAPQRTGALGAIIVAIALVAAVAVPSGGARALESPDGGMPDTVSEAPQTDTTEPAAEPQITATAPRLTGSPRVGQTLAVDAGEWLPAETVLTYAWFADGSQIAGATGASLPLTAVHAGTRITVAVTGELEGAQSVTLTSEPSALVTGGVLITAVPTISGSAVVGATLTAKAGAWSAGATLRYQWYANGSAISGATGASLKVPTSVAGKKLTVKVTGTRPGFTDAARTSAATASVLRALTSATPKISGTPRVGSTLTASAGTWTSKTTLTYRWYADGKAISGATKKTLKLSSTQIGARITVTVTGTKSGYAKAAKTSAASGVVLGVLSAATPKVSGTARVGTPLKASAGSWTRGTTLSYQWSAGGKKISGATRSSFTPTDAQRGKPITVTVTGTKKNYAKTSRTSAATAAVQGVLRTATPTISGKTQVGSTLTAKAGTWTSGTKLTYRWYANGTVIKGATGSKLTLASAHQGKRITVAVSGSKKGYASASRTSGATAKITGRPSRTKPSSKTSCPSWAPIKGNHSSSGEWIYHVPSGRYYSATHPEECFSTESAARAAGYRKSKL